MTGWGAVRRDVVRQGGAVGRGGVRRGGVVRQDSAVRQCGAVHQSSAVRQQGSAVAAKHPATRRPPAGLRVGPCLTPPRYLSR
ncbi:hypothetical protein [Lentzea sp. E54]|uniref:hypothetical protein n=1 Tax=Lentzea xerophila TaxID=3435883 RepID=UPI003DA507DD